MKDRVFEGRDVPRALEAASLGLGLPASRIRYVVLEEGSDATASAPASPARIVVLMDASEASASEARPERPARAERPAAREPRAAGDAKPRLSRMVAAFVEATGEPLEVAFEDGDATLTVRVSGAGEALLLEHGGEALRALEHVMQRAVSQDEPRRLQLTSARFRGERDAFLRGLARELAEAVRSDGVPRESEPLNSYDRRILHLAIQDEPDLKSFSVGEGAARRVTIARQAAAGPAGTPEAS